MGKALPQKSSAEISHEVKWSMGEKASSGEQNGRNAATSRLVGGALKAVRTTRVFAKPPCLIRAKIRQVSAMH
jgi:hypothetical protein